MKNIISIFVVMGFLISCSTPKKAPARPQRPVTGDRLSQILKEDEKILNSLDEEPGRQGTMKKEVENGITTEIWTSKEEHGSTNVITEILIHKNGKLISRTLKNPATHYMASMQYHNGQVIQVSEEEEGSAIVVFLENEKIAGRMSYDNGEAECIIYDKGEKPRYEELETCELRFNTAP